MGVGGDKGGGWKDLECGLKREQYKGSDFDISNGIGGH